MAITFFCNGCSHQLQVPDETAGAQAKCPVCGTVMTIPVAAADFHPEESSSPFADSGVPPQGTSQAGPSAGGGPFRQQPGSPFAYFVPPIIPRRFDIGEAWSDTWAIYTKRLWWLVGLALLLFAINIGANIIENIIQTAAPMLGPAGIALFMIVMIAKQIFLAWISIGLLIYLLNVVAGRRAEISDLFMGVRYLLRYIGASIVLICGALAIFVVFAFLILGIYAATGNAFNEKGLETASPLFLGIGGSIALIGFICLMYYFLRFALWPLLMIDRNMGVFESLGMSAKLMRGNCFLYFVIQTATGIAAGVLGALACCVGLAFTIPFVWLLGVVLYYHIASLPIGYAYRELSFMSEPVHGRW